MPAKPDDLHNVDLEFLKSEFNRFRSEVAGMKDRLGGNASEVLDQMSAYLDGHGVSSRVSALEAQLEKLAGKAKDSGKVAVDRLEAQMSERPLASLAVAFGVGLLAAQLVRRS
ncbi:MAG: hypothetical protein POG74_11380 [Acidocella sp.]|nr:hypothetical protein [Acidocella sp.]